MSDFIYLNLTGVCNNNLIWLKPTFGNESIYMEIWILNIELAANCKINFWHLKLFINEIFMISGFLNNYEIYLF